MRLWRRKKESTDGLTNLYRISLKVEVAVAEQIRLIEEEAKGSGGQLKHGPESIKRLRTCEHIPLFMFVYTWSNFENVYYQYQTL